MSNSGGMRLTDAQKKRILQCIEQGMSNRAIAEAVKGVSYETVRKYRQKLSGSKVVTKVVNEVVNNVVTQSPSQSLESEASTIANPTSAHDRDKMAGEVLSDIDLICDMARDGLKRARTCDNEKQRVWMETQYGKILKDTIRIKGTWAGLDSMVESDNTILKQYADQLKKFETTDPEGWEVTP